MERFTCTRIFRLETAKFAVGDMGVEFTRELR